MKMKFLVIAIAITLQAIVFSPSFSYANAADVSSSSSSDQELCKQCETIHLVFHLFGNSDTTNSIATNWTDDAIEEFIVQQNTLWVDTPFLLTVTETLRYDNAIWAFYDFYSNEGIYDEVIAPNRKGGRTTANIFVNDAEICTYGGYVGLVQTDQAFPVDEFSRGDFITFCASYISDKYYFTHLLGHWFSLLDTWEGSSCDASNVGDGVDDTPLQSISSEGTCDPKQDSCPDSDGLDAVYNHMDLSTCDDKSFTEGQLYKMHDFFREFRALSKSCSSKQVKFGFDIQFDSIALNTRLQYQHNNNEASDMENKSLIESEEPINFNDKRVTGHRCFERHSLYKVAFSADDIVTFDSPGYIALLADENTIINTTTSAKSYLLSLDTECTKGKSRLKFELGLDNLPNETRWEILDRTKTKIADHTLTTGGGGVDKYDIQYSSSVVLFEICLQDEAYTLKVTDTGGDGLSPPGYYKLFLDNNLISSSEKVSTLVEIPFIVGTYQPSTQNGSPNARPSSSAPSYWLTSATQKTIWVVMSCVYMFLIH